MSCREQSPRLGHHLEPAQPAGDTYFWEDMLLPLSHAVDGIALQSGRKQESTKMLYLPNHEPCWSRPAGGLPTLASTMGLSGAGAAPSALLQGGGTGPL